MGRCSVSIQLLRRRTHEVSDTISLGRNRKQIYYSFMLLLSCLTSANLTAYDMIKFFSEMKHRGGIAEAFWRIDLLVKRWNYKADEASKIVSNIVEKGEFRDFLSRFSQSISVGMNMRDFLVVESTKYMITFDSEYWRTTDKLKQIAETFSAILTSVSFMAISMLISNMVFSFGDAQTMLTVTALAIAGTLFILDFFIYVMSPKETLVHDYIHKPFGLVRLFKINTPLLLFGLIAGFSIPALLLLLPGMTKNLSYPVGIPLILLGIPLFLFGRTARRRVKNIKDLEEQYPPFIRNLGDAITSTASAREALVIIRASDYGKLNGPILRMDRKMYAGMGDDIAWKMFIEECGSSLISNHMHAFTDSLALGAKAAQSSDAVFNSLIKTYTRRKKRELVTGFLKAIAIPLQVTFTAVLILIHALVTMFSGIANSAGQYLTMLTPSDPVLVAYYVYTIIVATAFGTAIAVHFLEGESPFGLTYFSGLQMLTTGLVIIVGSIGAEALLGQFTVVSQTMPNIGE